MVLRGTSGQVAGPTMHSQQRSQREGRGVESQVTAAVGGGGGVAGPESGPRGLEVEILEVKILEVEILQSRELGC